jgi:Fe-S-cluster containining protein
MLLKELPRKIIQLTSTMQEKERRWKRTGKARPESAVETIRNAFSKMPCEACGECCRGWTGIETFQFATNLNQISRMHKALQDSGIPPERFYEFLTTQNIEGSLFGELRLNASRSCKSLSGKLCRIYEERPELCRIFPLDVIRNAEFAVPAEIGTIYGRDEFEGCLSLRLKCTVLNDLYYREITHIRLTDVYGPDGEVHIPMIDSVLRSFLSSLGKSNDKVYSARLFSAVNGEETIDILPLVQ